MHASRRFALTLCLALTFPALSQSGNPELAPARRSQSASSIGSTISVASLRIAPSAWEHFAKAKQADLAGREEDFAREFSRALAIEPNFGALYLLRANRLVRLQRLDAALADVLTAQRIEPRISSAATILGSIYNGLHRYSDALLVLNALHGAEAGSWQVAYELTRSYIGRGDVEQALRTSALTLKIAPEACHDALLLRANALSIANRASEAVDHLRLYLASGPAPAVAAQVERAIENLRMQPSPTPSTEIASN